MSFANTIQRLFRRSPLIRTLFWVLLVLLIIGFTAAIGRTVQRKPAITKIDPSVGSPGDIMVITGNNFGSSRGSSYVELGGSRITASGYLAWTDSQIKIILPANVQDGLVLVGTSAGRSDSEFFANKAGIPVAVRPDVQISLPAIESISPEAAATGQLVTIKGSNFGSVRGTSTVFFTAKREALATSTEINETSTSPTELPNKSDFISANENDFDYEFWSDTEIHVRVPDGAGSGQIYVQTAKGSSTYQKFTMLFNAGEKTYTGKRTYIIQVSADIANAVSTSNATVTLYVPRPPVTSFQPSVELTECFPEPLIKDDRRVIIHQKTLSQLTNRKQRFTQNFVVSNYTVTSAIKAQNILPFSDTKRLLYSTYTSADSLIPAKNSAIVSLRDKILSNTTNPYTQAKLIYDYLIANYKILSEVRTGSISVLDMLNKQEGDAYDFAILYTTLCRAAGIPAIPIGGILVQDKSICQNHWWTEIYFENYGWFPVDISLAAGLEYKPFTQIANPKVYYFGNLDSQHIAFSLGWNDIKPSLAGSKNVFRPRTYALQSIWEEATSGTTSYSSLWNDPVILGIY